MFPAGSKPYILRALYEWSANEMTTPHVVVDVDKNCSVPSAYVKDGMITFNIGMNATKDLQMDDDWISFSARFSGQAQQIAFPVARVQAFFVRETQEGVPFLVEDDYELPDDDAASAQSNKADKPADKKSDKPKSSGGLKIVK